MSTKLTGLSLSFIGVVVISPDALVLRWVAMDHGTLLLWRGLFLFAGFSAVILYQYQLSSLKALSRAGWFGVLSGFLFAINTFCYTKSIQLTSVTAAMMIISTAPVFAALISWLLLKERINYLTAIVIICTLVGIAIIAADSEGHNTITGNLFALVCAVSMAMNFVLARFKSARDLTPGLVFSGLFIVLLAVLEGADSAMPETLQLGAIAIIAMVALPIGFTLLQIAPRYISATDVSLFLLLEAVLAPFWVWLVLSEIPSVTTLIGSVVICLTLSFYGYLQYLKTPI
ncbi:MAG: drug/metabolite transporter (DMT)-like permease [Cellvibrionaceae bacterium]|jgi:drug/metabolite transporter (DMT)-like permease